MAKMSMTYERCKSMIRGIKNLRIVQRKVTVVIIDMMKIFIKKVQAAITNSCGADAASAKDIVFFKDAYSSDVMKNMGPEELCMFMLGLGIHEMYHLFYTDFDRCFRLMEETLDGKHPEFKNLCSSSLSRSAKANLIRHFANIIEDAHIERRGAKNYPKFAIFIDYVNMVYRQYEGTLADRAKEAKGAKFSIFFFFVLHFAVHGRKLDFEGIPDEMKALCLSNRRAIMDCVYENNSVKRCYKSIELLDRLLPLLEETTQSETEKAADYTNDQMNRRSESTSNGTSGKPQSVQSSGLKKKPKKKTVSTSKSQEEQNAQESDGEKGDKPQNDSGDMQSSKPEKSEDETKSDEPECTESGNETSEQESGSDTEQSTEPKSHSDTDSTDPDESSDSRENDSSSEEPEQEDTEEEPSNVSSESDIEEENEQEDSGADDFAEADDDEDFEEEEEETDDFDESEYQDEISDEESEDAEGSSGGNGGDMSHHSESAQDQVAMFMQQLAQAIQNDSLSEETEDDERQALRNSISGMDCDSVSDLAQQISREYDRPMAKHLYSFDARFDPSVRTLVDDYVKKICRMVESEVKTRTEGGIVQNQLSGTFASYRIMDYVTKPGANRYKMFDRNIPGEEGLDICVELLIDESGSMGRCRDNAVIIAAIIHDICVKLDIPIRVASFDDECYLYCDFDAPMRTSFETQICNYSPTGGTDEASALLCLEKSLLKRPEAFKYLFLITDGCPGFTPTSGKNGRTWLKEYQQAMIKKGVQMIACCTGSFADNVAAIYDGPKIIFNDFPKLAKRLTTEFLRPIRSM